MSAPDGTAFLTLVRHGRTAFNAAGRFQGWADVPLDDVGRAQAERVAARLAEADPRPTRLVSSDLLRTRQTAEAIAARLGLAVETAPELREIHVGDWEGRAFADVPAPALDAWPLVAAPNGESLGEVAARLRAFHDRLALRAGEHVVLVSHGAAIGALLADLEGWDLAQTWATRRAEHRNTALTTYAVDAAGARTCLALACARHLDEVPEGAA